jgi:hypothetical protein
MKIPVVLSVVHVAIDADRVMAVDVDGVPRDSGQSRTRGDLRAVIDEITKELGAPVRVEVREADGSTYSDIATPPESPAPAAVEPSPTTSTPSLAGAGFQPGEEVAQPPNDLDAVFIIRNGTWHYPANVQGRLWHIRHLAEYEDLAALRDVSPHSFRRTVAAEIDEVYGAEAAMSQLGHTSKTVTERHYINRRLVVPTTGPPPTLWLQGSRRTRGPLPGSERPSAGPEWLRARTTRSEPVCGRLHAPQPSRRRDRGLRRRAAISK